MLEDFNIHVNDSEDQDAALFVETLTALGLQIHNVKPTHKCGNTLDLIISECSDRIRLVETRNGQYLSEHCS